MTVYLLPEAPVFPPAGEADEDGLLAIGGDLSGARILEAYRNGIFPWFEEDGTIFWFSPDPRMVLFPDRFHASKSLRRTIRSKKFEIRFDSDFETVIRHCALATRPDQEGTWIGPDFIDAYTGLFRAGFAHSIEVLHNGRLAGGLYGLSIGSAFFGESMFSYMPDASKVGLEALTRRVTDLGLRFIDCQVESPHLLKLGAVPIPRSDYLVMVKEACLAPTVPGPWEP